MSTIHGKSHEALKYFHDHYAALAVYWIICSRVNGENVSWPSADGLARDTGWSRTVCLEARQWLIEHGALQAMTSKEYVRPEWRELSDKTRKRKGDLDRTIYCRPTGNITIDGKTYPLLYVPQNEKSDSETYESPSAGRSDEHDSQADTPELDSSSTELSTSTSTKDSAPPENGAVTPEDFTLYDKPAAPGNISDKQWLAAMPVYRLGEAIDIPPTESDWSNYKGVANKLISSGITPDKFSQYVYWVRQQAEQEGGWRLTLNSLTANGRMSAFIAKQNQPSKPNLAVPTDFNDDMEWMQPEDMLKPL